MFLYIFNLGHFAVASQVLFKPCTFKNIPLKLTKVDPSEESENDVHNEIEVSNVPQNVSEDLLKTYFESRKSEGCSNAVSECKKINPGIFRVSFKNHQGM